MAVNVRRKASGDGLRVEQASLAFVLHDGYP